MNRMPTARRFNRWLLRPVMLVLALAQLVVVLAPAVERVEDRDSGIHLETQGTRQHYVHDDTACPACQVHHLVGRVVAPERIVAVPVLEPHIGDVVLAAIPTGHDHYPASPRAPPVARAG